MAKLSRADLKLFFETGDKPTQDQFADLIDSLLSLIDDSNLADLIKIKSETDGKIEVVFSDSFWQLTTDGGNFLESFIFLNSVSAFLASPFSSTDWDGAGITHRVTNERLYRVIANNSTIFQIVRTNAGLNKFKIFMPTFADNVAAIAGGLLINDMYKTATGEVRTVV